MVVTKTHAHTEISRDTKSNIKPITIIESLSTVLSWVYLSNIHKCTKFDGKKMQHTIGRLLGINNNYEFLLPEDVCCSLQTCFSVLMKT